MTRTELDELKTTLERILRESYKGLTIGTVQDAHHCLKIIEREIRIKTLNPVTGKHERV